MGTVAVRNGTLVTLGPAGTIRGDLLIEDGRIGTVGGRAGPADVELDATGCLVLPGYVQAHVHLCQTLFRGLAEDLDVMEWLRRWVWPLEQALDADTMAASCRLGTAELLTSGTTTFLSMESVGHTDESFAAVADLGARAFIGKALMDHREPGTPLLGESTDEAWADLMRLYGRWHGSEDGRLNMAVSPRAPRGASPRLWTDAAKFAAAAGLTLHTHVNENHGQSELVAGDDYGRDVHALHAWGALTERTVMAHCVWLDGSERDLIARTGANVAHCPSANLKLASGIAPVPELLARGVNVALGSDGAACNNTLDMQHEMRLASLVQRPAHGPDAMPAERVLAMATLGGAKALGLAEEIGSLETGKQADLQIVAAPLLGPDEARLAARHLVHTATAADVRTVLVAGRVVVQDGRLVHGDLGRIQQDAVRARPKLLSALAKL